MIHLLGCHGTSSLLGKSSCLFINIVEYNAEKTGDLYTQSQTKPPAGQILTFFVNTSE